VTARTSPCDRDPKWAFANHDHPVLLMFRFRPMEGSAGV
jgi:hypothetical protein